LRAEYTGKGALSGVCEKAGGAVNFGAKEGFE